ncbi:ATP-dependent DNA helicase [Trichonephila clavipes]|nr:ATP-dependent DNA helicase [Trichonephila clavipes]
MLFTNWRNENADILIQDFKQLYTTNLETIRSNRKEFVADENLDLEEELMQLEKSRAIEENEEKSEERSLVTFEPVLDYDENELVENISLDMNASHGKGFSIFQPTNKYPDDKYRELVQKCNSNIRCSNVAGALHKPKGITLNCHSPCPVVEAVFSSSSGWSSTYQYPLLRSRVENKVLPGSVSSVSSILGR